MHGTPRVLCLLLVVALGLPPAFASDDVAAGVKQARDRLARDLEAVATWCHKKKLFGRRDEVFERLLELDPDHAEARKRLKYARNEDGSWTQSPKYKRPYNGAKSLLPDADRREADAVARHDRALLEVGARATGRTELDAALSFLREIAQRKPDDDDVSRALRDALMRHAKAAEAEDRFDLAARSKRELTDRFPDDPEIRTFAGDVRLGDRWVLPETVTALRRRKDITAIAAKVLAATAMPKEDPLTGKEQAVEIPWSGAFVTPHVRVLGTSPAESLRAIAHACEAAAPFFEQVVGRQPGRNPVFTFVVFEKKAHWDTYLRQYAPLTEADRAAAGPSQMSGWSFSDGRYAVRHVGGPHFELDLAVDVIFQHFLFNTYCKWDVSQGAWTPLRAWVNVGLSDYLTFRLIGTRLLTTVGGSYQDTAADFKERLPDLQRAWLGSARKVLVRENVPGTHMLLGKYLGAFGKDDALAAYGLAGYVVEAHPQRIDRLLRSVGQNRPPKESFLQGLDLSISALHVQLVRWLREMSALD